MKAGEKKRSSNLLLFKDLLKKSRSKRSAEIDEQIVERELNEAVRDKMAALEAWSSPITRKYKPYFRAQRRCEKEQADKVEKSVRKALREQRGK